MILFHRVLQRTKIHILILLWLSSLTLAHSEGRLAGRFCKSLGSKTADVNRGRVLGRLPFLFCFSLLFMSFNILSLCKSNKYLDYTSNEFTSFTGGTAHYMYSWYIFQFRSLVCKFNQCVNNRDCWIFCPKKDLLDLQLHGQISQSCNSLP